MKRTFTDHHHHIHLYLDLYPLILHSLIVSLISNLLTLRNSRTQPLELTTFTLLVISSIFFVLKTINMPNPRFIAPAQTSPKFQHCLLIKPNISTPKLNFWPYTKTCSTKSHPYLSRWKCHPFSCSCNPSLIFLSHPLHPIHQKISLLLPSKYMQNSTTSSEIQKVYFAPNHHILLSRRFIASFPPHHFSPYPPTRNLLLLKLKTFHSSIQFCWKVFISLRLETSQLKVK